MADAGDSGPSIMAAFGVLARGAWVVGGAGIFGGGAGTMNEACPSMISAPIYYTAPGELSIRAPTVA